MPTALRSRSICGMALERARKLAPETGPDVQMLLKMTPGTGNTPEGRRTLVYLAERAAQYQSQMAEGASRIPTLWRQAR